MFRGAVFSGHGVHKLVYSFCKICFRKLCELKSNSYSGSLMRSYTRSFRLILWSLLDRFSYSWACLPCYTLSYLFILLKTKSYALLCFELPFVFAIGMIPFHARTLYVRCFPVARLDDWWPLRCVHAWTSRFISTYLEVHGSCHATAYRKD